MLRGWEIEVGTGGHRKVGAWWRGSRHHRPFRRCRMVRFGAGRSRRSMRAKVRVLIPISVCLVWPALLRAGVDESCVTECMERSGCWSGASVSMPGYCNNKPELCNIECSTDSWGAIAYSWKDKTAGWAYGKSNRTDAVRIAMQACAKEGGAKCILQTSFNGICGSVAADGDLVAWGNADSKENAQRRALAECARLGAKNCALQATVCSIWSPTTGRAGPPSPAPPPRQISWGAIAYSERDMGAGWSMGKDDRASAEKEAMNECSQRGKACVLRTAFNKQCGALAADGSVSGWGTAADQRESQQRAIEECKKAGGARCALRVSICSR